MIEKSTKRNAALKYKSYFLPVNHVLELSASVASGHPCVGSVRSMCVCV